MLNLRQKHVCFSKTTAEDVTCSSRAVPFLRGKFQPRPLCDSLLRANGQGLGGVVGVKKKKKREREMGLGLIQLVPSLTWLPVSVLSTSFGDKGLHLNQTLAPIQTEEPDPSSKLTKSLGSFWHLFSPSKTASLYSGSLANTALPSNIHTELKGRPTVTTHLVLPKTAPSSDAHRDQICYIKTSLDVKSHPVPQLGPSNLSLYTGGWGVESIRY